MTIQQLRTAYRARPFCPFNIHIADGRSFHVPQPEYLSMSPSGRTVIVFQEDDESSILDLLTMTEIEMNPTGTTRA